MKKTIAMILALSLCIGLCACGAAQEDATVGVTEATDASIETTAATETQTESTVTLPDIQTPSGEVESLANYRVSLAEVATFEGNAYLSTTYGVLRDYTERDGFRAHTLYSYDGQDKLGEPVHSFSTCGNGIVIASVYTSASSNVKLVNVDTGEVYLADNAATISKVSDRFYYVSYITEETDNEDECFIYATKADDSVKMQTFVSLPSEGDIMYKGYAKIFDLQQKQFVSGLRIENRDVEVTDHKGTICLYDYNTWSFYSADGSLLAENMTSIAFGEDFIVRRSSEGCELYDANLNKLNFLEGATCSTIINNRCSDRYFSYKENGLIGIMTATGEKITDPVYNKGGFDTQGDYIMCYCEDETYEVIYKDGTVVIPGGTFQHVDPLGDLPAITLRNDKKYTYYFGGTIQEDTTVNNVMVSSRDTDQYLIYSTEEWVRYEEARSLTNGLLQTDEGIVEVFTGSVLLPGKVTTASATDDYLYIYNDDTHMWTVYSITLTKG